MPSDRYDARALAVAVMRACRMAKCKPHSPYMPRQLKAVEFCERYGLESGTARVTTETTPNEVVQLLNEDKDRLRDLANTDDPKSAAEPWDYFCPTNGWGETRRHGGKLLNVERLPRSGMVSSAIPAYAFRKTKRSRSGNPNDLRRRNENLAHRKKRKAAAQ